MEEKKKNPKEEKGLFTQMPDVLLLTCDLSDEVLMTFNRIHCETKFKECVFYGSIRKFASTLGMKRDKAHRNLNTLKTSGLVTVKEIDEMNITAIQLNMDGLWELNKLYHQGIPVPRWSNLKEVLEGVRKIGQASSDTTDEVSEISDNLSQKSDDLSEISDTLSEKSDDLSDDSCSKSPRRVREITENYIDNSKKDIASLASLLFDYYCELEEEPKNRALALQHCIKIAEAGVETREHMQRLHTIAATLIPGDDKWVKLGNMSKKRALTLWKEEQRFAVDPLGLAVQQPVEEPIEEDLPEDWQTAELPQDLITWTDQTTPAWHTQEKFQANCLILQDMYRTARLPLWKFYDMLAASARDVAAKVPENEIVERVLEYFCDWVKIPMPEMLIEALAQFRMEAVV
jgi:hypothetical protein